MKYIQNQIAVSRQTLPTTMVYSAVVWLLAGVIQEGWWMIQFPLFLISAFLMMQAQQRQYAHPHLQPDDICVVRHAVLCGSVSLSVCHGGFVQFCFIVSILSLFNTYQEAPSHRVALLCLPVSLPGESCRGQDTALSAPVLVPDAGDDPRPWLAGHYGLCVRHPDALLVYGCLAVLYPPPRVRLQAC